MTKTREENQDITVALTEGSGSPPPQHISMALIKRGLILNFRDLS